MLRTRICCGPGYVADPDMLRTRMCCGTGYVADPDMLRTRICCGPEYVADPDMLRTRICCGPGYVADLDILLTRIFCGPGSKPVLKLYRVFIGPLKKIVKRVKKRGKIYRQIIYDLKSDLKVFFSKNYSIFSALIFIIFIRQYCHSKLENVATVICVL